MGNTMRNAKRVLGIFDLKGSMVNRFVKKKDGKPYKSTQTLKDQNLIKMSTENNWLNFSKRDRN